MMSTDATMMSADAIAKYNSLREQHTFVFALVYRGHWCPFCIAHIKSLVELIPAITAAGGTTVILTAQPEAHLAEVRTATGYQGEAISDPENKLVGELKKEKLVDVAISSKNGYEHGMAQPAILVQTKEGKVLESWAIVPALMNVGGASDRPVLGEVWQNVEAKLGGKEAPHMMYTKHKFLSFIKEKIFGK